MAETLKPVFCGHDCGGNACPLLAHVEGSGVSRRVTRISHNPAAGPWIRGCRRGHDLPKFHYSPERLKAPLIRTGARGSGRFREATWEEALGLVAERLGETRALHGNGSILSLASAGSIGALQATQTLTARFLDAGGGHTRLTGNYSNGAARSVLPWMFGDAFERSGFDAATMRNASMIILWGANILDTRLGSEMPARLMEASARGVPIVVIDPRRTSTARIPGARWVPCRPGTDTALMLALLHVLFCESLVDEKFWRERATGLDPLKAYVLGESPDAREGNEPRTPEWAEVICGIPAGRIRSLAREWAFAKPAMLVPGYSIQRVWGGEETFRLCVALQMATGNFGVVGGSTGSVNNRQPAPRMAGIGSVQYPARGPGDSIPILRWPDAILEGKAGGYPSDIRAIYAAGSNLLNQGGDIGKGIRAMESLDFSVCHEMFMSPTARWCDVVLPAASPMEKEDMSSPWAGNYILYKEQILPQIGMARDDYSIFAELAERSGCGDAFSCGRSAREWVDVLIAASDIPDKESFRRTGIHAIESMRAGCDDFAADPQGHPLGTPSGKVEIECPSYAASTGLPAIPRWRGEAEGEGLPGNPSACIWPLLLITPKAGTRTHSQMVPGGVGDDSGELSMNPVDAAARRLAGGDMAQVRNRRGAIAARVKLDPDIMAGVVSLAEGAWDEADKAGSGGRGSVNRLTGTEGTGADKSCVMHAIPVEVEALAP